MSSSDSRVHSALARVPVMYWCLAALVGPWVLVYLVFSRPSISAEDFDAGASDLEESFPAMVEVSDQADFGASGDPHTTSCPTGISGQSDLDVIKLRAGAVDEVDDETAAEEVLADIEEAWTGDDGWELEDVGTTSGRGDFTGVSRYTYTREWGGTLDSQAHVDHVHHEESDGRAIQIRITGDCLRHIDGRSSVGEYEFDMPSFEGYSWDQEDDSD